MVRQATTDRFLEGNTYPVFELGPFGNDCEVYEMGVSPLNDNRCGEANERYLISYKNTGAGERLVVPIFHGNGLAIDHAKNQISDENMEYASLSDFEHYIKGQTDAPLEWNTMEK